MSNDKKSVDRDFIHKKNLENVYLDLSEKNKIPIIASQEIFYINQDMYEAHDALLCIGEKTYVDELNRKKYSDQHYIKPQDEISKIYKDIPEALENNYYFPFRFKFTLNSVEAVGKVLQIDFIKLTVYYDEAATEEGAISLRLKSGILNIKGGKLQIK